MFRSPAPKWAVILITTVSFGCSGSDSSTVANTGGAAGQGGATTVTSGGMVGIAGTASIGGNSSTGGVGGVTSSGGAALGGNNSTGGTTVTGGMASTGGSKAAGGATATGGVNATGGSSVAAGGKATGGLSSTGGMPATGGTNATGGTLTTGGTKSTGGTPSTGGSAATGGGSSVLGAAPPMGWNSWNTFQCNMDETLIKAVADVMVSSGMQAAGYQYVNLDDCWMNGRDSSGALRWNTTKFPSGIPSLATYVHGKGLKFGIYESANNATCVGIYGGISTTVAVGSLGHEAQDATTFASWGVDFLKYDLCAGSRNSIVTMGSSFRAGSRPILYSINPGNGQNDLDPPKAGWDMLNVANIWRIGFDISADWASVIRLIDENAGLYSYAGPGHFNDPDMLEVGKLANATEDRAHFSMWAMMAAPLIAGNDIRSMSTATHDILTNTEVVAVDQDSLGYQGRLVATPQTGLQIWSKNLTGSNVRAAALFNRNASAASITVTWANLGLPTGNATVRDLWQKSDLGTFNGSYTATNVPSHGVVLLRVMSTP